MNNKQKKPHEKIIYGFKGTNEKGCCRNQKYVLRKKYSITNNLPITVCSNGFHMCTKPLDVLTYYEPLARWDSKTVVRNRFFTAEGSGKSSYEPSDSKVAVEHIRLKEEIGLEGLAMAHLSLSIPNNYEVETSELCYMASRHTVSTKNIAIMDASECISIDRSGPTRCNAFRWMENPHSYIKTGSPRAVVGIYGNDSVADISGNGSFVIVQPGYSGVEVTGNNCVIYVKNGAHVRVTGSNCLVILRGGQGYVECVAGTTILWSRTMFHIDRDDTTYHRAVVKEDGLYEVRYSTNALENITDEKGKQ